MNYIKATLHLAIISVLSSCLKFVPLDEFEGNLQGVDIIVEGFVATDYVNPIVRLSEPLNFDEIYKKKLVSGATVTLSDGTDTVDLTEHGELKGYYTTKTEFNGQVGKTYTLTIEYKGKTYKASDELVAVPAFDENRFPFKKDISIPGDYNIKIERHQFGFETPSISVFEYATTYEIRPNEGPTKTVSFIGEREHPENWEEFMNPLAPFTYDNSKLEGSDNIDIIYAHTKPRLDASFPFHTNTPTFFYEKDKDKETKINIYQFSVSDAYYSYLLTIFSDTEWGGLLSSLPGKAKSNLSEGDEGALGYFWATDIKKAVYNVKDL